MDQSLLNSLRVVALPTKTNFRGINIREVALFMGEYGWAEFSPFLEYEDAECAPWLACAIEAATQPRPKLFQTTINVNGTIPAINDEKEISQIVDLFPGVKSFKLKVGDDTDLDLARINRVRTLRPDCAIRVDVNGAWTVDQAVSFLKLAGELEYIEQPCASIEELRELKKRIDVRIAGDEVLRKATDPFALNLIGAVDILMLKVQPLGGIKRTHDLIDHHQLPVVVSSALESAIGIAYGLVLAGSLENLGYGCGLATGALLAKDVADIPIINGQMKISSPVPNFDGLDVSKERFEWWKNRIMRTAELL
uniref:o-succinylbenzoate synthase n=1 Tax=Candidatus Planktophila sp. TaxID=2175601 RepID=UPI00404A7AC4